MANIDKNIEKTQKTTSTKEVAPQPQKKELWWLRAIRFFFIGLAVLFISFLVVINLPWVKNKIAQRAIDMLNNQYTTTFKTDNVEVNFLGDVVITGISATDHHHFTFAKAKKIVAHSDWLALISNTRDLKFQKLTLEGLDLKVITYKGENQDNFTKYIAKFDTPKDPTKPPSKFTSRIEIIDSKVSIVNQNKGRDGLWLKAEKVNAYASDVRTVGPDVKLKLNRMSFVTERWGKKHILETLSGNVKMSREKLELKDLVFSTNQSLLQGDLILNMNPKTRFQDFNNKVIWDLNIKLGSVLSGYDISYFVKNWDNYQRYGLVGKMKGTLNDFILKDFIFRAKDNEISTPEIKFSKLMAGDFSIKTNKILAKLTYPSLRSSLPTFIAQKMGNFADDFGLIRYNGLADINKNRVIAKGQLNTSVGQAQILSFQLTDFSSKKLNYQGVVVLEDFNAKAITKKDEVRLISGKFDIKGEGFDLNTLSLTTKSNITSIQLLDKTLRNIGIDGSLVAKQFNGMIHLGDDQARGVIDGKFDFSKPKIFADFQANMDYLNLGYFGIVKGNSTFTGKVNGSLSMTNINDLDLYADLNDVTLGGDKNIHIPNGNVKITTENGNRLVAVDMPGVATGQVVGRFNLGDLGGMFQEAMNKVLAGNTVKRYYREQSFTMDFDVDQKLIDFIEPNIKIKNGARISGNFVGNSVDLSLDILAPSLTYIMEKKEEITEADRLFAQSNPEYTVREGVKRDSVMVDSIALKINTMDAENYWSANVSRVEYQKNILKDISLKAQKEQEKVKIAINLLVGTLEKEKNNQMAHYVANIEQSVNANGDYVVRFVPTEFKFNNTSWLVDTSPELNHSVVYRKKTKDFQVNNLRLYSDDSEILINGIFKSGKDFDFSGEVKNMEIDKLWAVLQRDSNMKLEGLANGTLHIKMNQNLLQPLVDIQVDNIKVNDNLIGNLVMNAGNSGQPNVYSVDAKIHNSELFSDEMLSLTGTINNNTTSPTLDLKAKLNEFNVSVAQIFVKDIFSNFRGKASGEVDITGTLKDIRYGGDIAMKDFGLKVNFSGVDYTFDDTVITVSNGNLIFNLVGIKDSRTNSKGTISIGTLDLSDPSNIGAELLIRADNLMLLNTTQRDFDLFWGMIYAKGDIFVGFHKNTLKIDAKADVLSNSVFTLNSGSASSVDEFKMLRFLQEDEGGNIEVAERVRTGLALDVNLDVTMDKSSTVNVLVGDQIGDISVRGETQNMKFNLDKTGRISMYGGYFVDSGTYVSKAILEKNFQIQKGSSIQWNGDVMNPELDITANYNALVSNMGEYLSVGRLPAVNVTLQTKITNTLKNPVITPEVTAPQVSSQIREVMNTKMATEEEKILQFASVLALGNFNVAQTSGFSAVSSGVNVFFKQLSSAFNSISNDFQIDLDYIKGSESSNTGDRANTSMRINVSPRWKIKTGVGVPLSRSINTQNNYLSGEGIIEYDWSKTIDGSKIFRAYSKPSNVGLVTGSSAAANQSYGGGVVVSYGFDRIFPKRKSSKKQKNSKNQIPKDTIRQDTVKNH